MSTLSRLVTNYLRSLEKCYYIGAYDPLTIFNAKLCRESPLNGGFSVHISYKIIPRDQISLKN